MVVGTQIIGLVTGLNEKGVKSIDKTETPDQLPRRVGSSMSRSQSPSRLKARLVTKITNDGKTTIHHAVSK